MACLGLIRRGCGTLRKSHFGGHAQRGIIAGRLARLALCSLVVSLAWTAVCAGQAGLGIGFGIGAQYIEGRPDLPEKAHLRLAMEIASPLMLNNHLDFALVFGYSPLGSVDDEFSSADGNDVATEFYTDEFFLLDMRVAARLYPFGNDGSVRPFVGGGLGYFWLFDRWDYRRVETLEAPPETNVTKDEGTESIARDFFPFVLTGLAVAVSDNTELLFEFQYDFEKDDSDADLSGPILMFGGRYRF